MKAKTTPPGTIVSGNVVCPIFAIDKINEFGDRIFYNSGNGMESIFIGGRQLDPSLAADEHRRLLEKAAPELFTALQMVCDSGCALADDITDEHLDNIGTMQGLGFDFRVAGTDY